LAGQFGAYAPIAAEQTTSGYDLCWELSDGDSYGVSGLDSSGNSTLTIVSPTSGTNPALESVPVFHHQDVNRWDCDGQIRALSLTAEAITLTQRQYTGLNDNIPVIRVRESWSSLVSKSKKRHPALKHGAYSSTAVLPGEDPAEFEELHQGLIAELAPTGALEEDVVADIARLVWRKQNLAIFRRAEDARAIWSELRQKIGPTVERYSTPSGEMTVCRDRDGRRTSSQLIHPDGSGTLTVFGNSQLAKVDAPTNAMTDEMRKELGENSGLVEIGDTATVEGLSRDLEIEERLGALIDKCLKRLLYLRGLKSLPTASSSAPPQPSAEPRRIPRPTRAA
jgi:hypothetical protein